MPIKLKPRDYQTAIPAPEPLPVGQQRTNTWYPDEHPEPAARGFRWPGLAWFAAAELVNGVACAGWLMTMFAGWLRADGMPAAMSVALCLALAFVAVMIGATFAWRIMEMER